MLVASKPWMPVTNVIRGVGKTACGRKAIGSSSKQEHIIIWLNIAASRTRGAERENNIRLRDAVALKTSRGQLA
jgi:hypothetical protein